MPVVNSYRTSWQVATDSGNGSVEVNGHGLSVYVDQPGRPCVVGSDRFCALTRTLTGDVRRYKGTADEHFAVAEAVLAEFDASPYAAARQTQGRASAVNELLDAYDRLDRPTSEDIARLERRREDIVEARRELARVAADPTATLPYRDTLPHLWSTRERGW